WDGPGISSTPAHSAILFDGVESRAIGYAINSDLPAGGYTTFAGQPVVATDILLRYTRTGDANLDGKCDAMDAAIVAAHYDNGATPGRTWAQGDFNFDGRIDDADVTLL